MTAKGYARKLLVENFIQLPTNSTLSRVEFRYFLDARLTGSSFLSQGGALFPRIVFCERVLSKIFFKEKFFIPSRPFGSDQV